MGCVRLAHLGLALSVATLVVTGFGRYISDGGFIVPATVEQSAPPGMRGAAVLISAVTDFAVWNTMLVVVVIVLWWQGCSGGTRIVGAMGIEVVAIVAKAVFLAPWLATHALPSGSYVVAMPDTGLHAEGHETSRPELRYGIDFPATGHYVVGLRMSGDDWGAETVSMGIDGVAQPGATAIEVKPDGWWRWTSRLQGGERADLAVPSSGLHTVNLWVREDGARVDRIELRLDTADCTTQDDGLRIVVEAENYLNNTVVSGAGWRLEDGTIRDLVQRVFRTVRTGDLPSAHVARVLVTLGTVVRLVNPRRRGTKVVLVFAMSITVVAVVISRVALAAHTPIGSIGGVALGTMWLSWFARRGDDPRPER